MMKNIEVYHLFEIIFMIFKIDTRSVINLPVVVLATKILPTKNNSKIESTIKILSGLTFS